METLSHVPEKADDPYNGNDVYQALHYVYIFRT
jgi:hypothetical protein